MQKQQSRKPTFRTGSTSGIWLALLLAIGLHSVILILPANRPTPAADNQTRQIEVQLIKTHRQAQVLPEPIEKTAMPAQDPEPIPEPLEQVVKTETEPTAVTTPPAPLIEVSTIEFHKLSESKKKQLANTILSAQFITEESISDQIFGKQFDLEIADPQKEFHFPVRQSMVAMLDKPMPEVPFAYTPNLVRFAYAPGVKGDLQRFWDVITPEFGWRTRNGTSVKCVWVLVITACGWRKLPTAVSERHLRNASTD